MGINVRVMLGLGLFMTAIYAHLYFVPWRRLRSAVAAANRLWWSSTRAASDAARLTSLVGEWPVWV